MLMNDPCFENPSWPATYERPSYKTNEYPAENFGITTDTTIAPRAIRQKHYYTISWHGDTIGRVVLWDLHIPTAKQ